MNDFKERPVGEIRVLDHRPVPGYRKAFYLTVAAGALWLVLSFTGVV